jgi:hypothetical protein
MVDRNPTVAGNYAEKFGFLSPLPAADAGANRRGHRNRLTRQQLLLRRRLAEPPRRGMAGLDQAVSHDHQVCHLKHSLAVSRGQTQSCSNLGDRIWKSRPLV